MESDAECSGEEESQVVSSMRDGDEYFGAGMWDKAIVAYSSALDSSAPGATLEQIHAFSRRCTAYLRLSQTLRDRPAEISEAKALLGLSPVVLSELAVKDAQKLAALDPKNVQTYLLLGDALQQAEQYEECRNAYTEGLSLDPRNEEVQRRLMDLQKSDYWNQQKKIRAENRDDLDCVLCFKLLFEPVTTPCGHTFCRQCLSTCLRMYSHQHNSSNKCPICRRVLHMSGDIPVTITLANVIEKSFPAEYAERRAERLGRSSMDAHEPEIPLFVMSICFPGEKVGLNIFEPRYRIMVSRCLNGTRRFGMAAIVNGNLHPVACECEIVEAIPQDDGRFILDVVGRRRFRTWYTWEQDGYRMTEPHFFRDRPLGIDEAEAQRLAELVREVDQHAMEWVSQVRQVNVLRLGPDLRLKVADLLERAGEKPPLHEAEQLSFWAANVLPMDRHVRLQLLGMECTVERLERVRDEYISTLARGTASCSIM